MKIAILGSGDWGKNLVRNFYQILGDKNIVVCDLEPDKLLVIEKQYPGIETMTDFKLLLKRSDIDAIVIATPAPTHFRLARQFLLLGKHILVEKPIALKAKEAKELISLSKKKRKILMVDHLLKYHPVITEMKKRIEEGELGDIYYLYSQRLNLGVVRIEENALWSLGPHDISVFLYLIGKQPMSVSAKGGIYLQKEKGIEDVVTFNLDFNGGVKAYSHFSWLDPHKVRKITVVGSKKMFVFDDMEATDKYKIFDKGTIKKYNGLVFDVRYGDIVFPRIKFEEPLKLMCRHFIDCVKNNKQPLTNGNEGLQVVQILEAAQKSLKNNGKPIKL